MNSAWVGLRSKNFVRIREKTLRGCSTITNNLSGRLGRFSDTVSLQTTSAASVFSILLTASEDEQLQNVIYDLDASEIEEALVRELIVSPKVSTIFGSINFRISLTSISLEAVIISTNIETIKFC